MKRRSILILTLFLSYTLVFAQEPKLILPIGHTDFVNTALFSPDGTKVLTASDDHTAKIWDATSGVLLADLKGHTGRIHTVQFSPDGKTIVTAALDNTPKIWDATTGNLLTDLKGHTDWIEDVQFSPDGKKIVTAADDSTIKIWDAATGIILINIKDNKGGNYRIRILSTQFSPNGEKIITVSSDGTAKVWEVATGNILINIKGQNSWAYSAQFSLDGKKIISVSKDSSVKLWHAETGILITNLFKHIKPLWDFRFSPDGKKIVAISPDTTVKIFDAITGNLLGNLTGHSDRINSAQFSPDGKKIVTASYDGTSKIWDVAFGNQLIDLKGHTFYFNSIQLGPDGKKIVTASDDKTAKIWDITKGILLTNLKGHSSKVNAAIFSPDGKKIVTTSADNTAKIWNAETGNLLTTLTGHIDVVWSVQLSPDGKKIVTTSVDKTAKIWNVETGTLLSTLKGHNKWISSVQFSPDGKKIVTGSDDSTAKIWDVTNGTLLINIKESYDVHSAQFSPDGKKIVTASYSHASIWDAATGNLLVSLKGHTWSLTFAQFSPDGKKIVTASADNTAKVWDAETGDLLLDLKGHNSWVHSARFITDGKRIVTASEDGTAKIWDAETGNLLSTLKGHTSGIRSLRITSDEKKIITASYDGTAKLWDAENSKLLYTFFSVDSSDYLVIDNDYHYDGTEAARKLIYFTCASEIIGLDQVKDQLWVPNLAERRLNGETINAAKLSDLNVCNLTPIVDTIEQTASHYRFQITPRLGGLGATVVYVNNIEVKRLAPQQLTQQKGSYQLAVDKKELQKFFVTGKENSITVKSLTAKNSISSRYVSINEKGIEKNAIAPNLYAVVVGVSDYKGEGLDLKFAAKDAIDMANALDISAKKLLNTDGKEHVFIYRVHTAPGRDRFPEKNSIKQLFTEIGSKAQPNDILLVFFAGHGVIESEKNQFYFLTADASSVTVSGALKNVGISTEELADWIQPQVMKAQKRILIFDACNSGQALKEIISFNNDAKNLLASRGDENGKQKKAIEKLNEKSGMFILSASASDQKAYEIGKYNQGALTYSLLKAIKEQPDILEDRQYLNISRWFSAAEKTVGELSRETGTRQQPQMVSTSNYNIGLVDDDVRNKIILPFEKYLFTRSDFRNTEFRVDNLKLRNLVDKGLSDLSDENTGASLLFNPEYEGSNIYSLSCDYSVSNDEITASVILIKGGDEIKNKFEVKGKTGNIKQLSTDIVATIKNWADKKK